MRSVIWSALVLGGAALLALWLHNLEFEFAAPSQARRSVINAAVTEIEGWRYAHHDADGHVVVEVEGKTAHPLGRPDPDRGIQVNLDAPRLELERAPALAPGAARVPLRAGAARGFVAASPGGGFQARLEGGVQLAEGTLRITTETLLLNAPSGGALRSWAREQLVALRAAVRGQAPDAQPALEARLRAIETGAPDPLARLGRAAADPKLAPLLPASARAGLAPRSHLQIECPKPVRLSQTDPTLALAAQGLTAERPGDVLTLRPPVELELEARVLLGDAAAGTGTSIAARAPAGLRPQDRIRLTTAHPVWVRLLPRAGKNAKKTKGRATEIRFLGAAHATIHPVQADDAPGRDLRPIEVEIRGGLTLRVDPALRPADDAGPGAAGRSGRALSHTRAADLLLKDVSVTRAGLRLLEGRVLRWTGSTQRARLEGGSGEARAALAAEGPRSTADAGPAVAAKGQARRVRARVIEVDVARDRAFLLGEVELELPVRASAGAPERKGPLSGTWTVRAPAATVLFGRGADGGLSGVSTAVATSAGGEGVTVLGPPPKTSGAPRIQGAARRATFHVDGRTVSFVGDPVVLTAGASQLRAKQLTANLRTGALELQEAVQGRIAPSLWLALGRAAPTGDASSFEWRVEGDRLQVTPEARPKGEKSGDPRGGLGQLTLVGGEAQCALWGAPIAESPGAGRVLGYRVEGGQIRLERPREGAEIVFVEPRPGARSRQRLERELLVGGRRLRERVEADRFSFRRAEGVVQASGDVRLVRETEAGAPLVRAAAATLSVELTESGGPVATSTPGRFQPKRVRLDGGARDLEAVVYPAAWRSSTSTAASAPVKLTGRVLLLGFGEDPGDPKRVRLREARCEAAATAGACVRVVPDVASSAQDRMQLSGRRARFVPGRGGRLLGGVVTVEGAEGDVVLFERGARSGRGAYERVEAGRASLDLRRRLVRLRGGVRGAVRRPARSSDSADAKPEWFEVSSREADAELDLDTLPAGGTGKEKARRGIETLTVRGAVVFRYRGARQGIPTRVEAASARYDRLTGEVVFEGAPLRTDRGQTLRRLVVALD